MFKAKSAPVIAPAFDKKEKESANLPAQIARSRVVCKRVFVQRVRMASWFRRVPLNYCLVVTHFKVCRTTDHFLSLRSTRLQMRGWGGGGGALLYILVTVTQPDFP